MTTKKTYEDEQYSDSDASSGSSSGSSSDGSHYKHKRSRKHKHKHKHKHKSKHKSSKKKSKKKKKDKSSDDDSEHDKESEEEETTTATKNKKSTSKSKKNKNKEEEEEEGGKESKKAAKEPADTNGVEEAKTKDDANKTDTKKKKEVEENLDPFDAAVKECASLLQNTVAPQEAKLKEKVEDVIDADNSGKLKTLLEGRLVAARAKLDHAKKMATETKFPVRNEATKAQIRPRMESVRSAMDVAVVKVGVAADSADGVRSRLVDEKKYRDEVHAQLKKMSKSAKHAVENIQNSTEKNRSGDFIKDMTAAKKVMKDAHDSIRKIKHAIADEVC